MDKLIICTRCGGDACYTQQITSEISNYWCYSCGFISNSLMKDGEEYYNEQISTLPSLYLDLKYKDLKDQYWIPSIINIPDKGMVFAQGNSTDNWKWTAVKAIERTAEDKKKNVKHKVKWKMDMNNQAFFEERNYIDALTFIGILPE